MSQIPYFLVQINNTGTEKIARMLSVPYGAVTVRDALKRYGPAWNEIASFAVVRNPYDRAVSLYSSYYYANRHRVLEHNIDFVTFLNLTLKHERKPFYDRPRFFMSQWEWIKDYNDEQGVWALASYEKYNVAIETVFRICEIPLPIVIKPDREPHPYRWQKYYQGTDGQLAAALVREKWGVDFERLGYDETIPTLP